MGVSFHTLPRTTEDNIRSIFTAPPQQSFIAVDYAAMELRVLAHVAKDGNMQNAFNEGADLHTYTAKLLFNKQNISKFSHAWPGGGPAVARRLLDSALPEFMGQQQF